jgi:aminoglycoside phosphotransferase
MPADVVSSSLVISQQQVCTVLMDDYGTVYRLYVPSSQAAQYASLLSDAQTTMVSNEAANVALAQAAGMTLPAVMTLAQKKAAWLQILAGTYQAPVVTSPSS